MRTRRELIEDLPEDHAAVRYWRDMWAKLEAHEAAMYAWKAACNDLAVATGFDAAEKHDEVCYDRCWHIARRIFAASAQTVTGMRLKVAGASIMECDDDDAFTDTGVIQVYRSLVADIERIANTI